jgi:hypothetical protein
MNKIKFFASLLLFSLILPVIAGAGAGPEEETFPFQAQSPRFLLPTRGVETTVVRISNILFYFIVLVAVVMIVWAGITLVTAGGDPTKVDLARHLIMYALIAIAVGAIAWGLVNLVGSYIGRIA